MRVRQRLGLAVTVTLAIAVSGCGSATVPPAGAAAPAPSLDSPAPAPLPSASPTWSPSPSPTPRRSAKPKPSKTLAKPSKTGGDLGGAKLPPPGADGVPVQGAGTFTAAPGGTDIVGAGTTLVQYRVEVEDGITWGSIPVWTPARFAGSVDQIIANPRGWTASATAPITDPSQHMTDASWSFQRVSGPTYSVRIRLATPNTVDKLCGQYGVQTQGVYSCRYGDTEMINLRRWLNGVPGFGITLDEYHIMVIDHEMGHFLGFNHMLCPGPGKPAPVMQTQTIDLGGCAANPYPYAADGTFITGPWAAS